MLFSSWRSVGIKNNEDSEIRRVANCDDKFTCVLVCSQRSAPCSAVPCDPRYQVCVSLCVCVCDNVSDTVQGCAYLVWVELGSSCCVSCGRLGCLYQRMRISPLLYRSSAISNLRLSTGFLRRPRRHDSLTPLTTKTNCALGAPASLLVTFALPISFPCSVRCRSVCVCPLLSLYWRTRSDFVI